jgi:hypothetical protein
MCAPHAGDPLAKLERTIDTQIQRCHRKGTQARFFALTLKAMQICLAGSLPVLALADPAASKPAINGIIGACIVIIEGFQHSFKFDQFWIAYRRAAYELEGERRLHDMRAGPYEGIPNPDAILALRITDLMEQRISRWERTIQKGLGGRTE